MGNDSFSYEIVDSSGTVGRGTVELEVGRGTEVSFQSLSPEERTVLLLAPVTLALANGGHATILFNVRAGLSLSIFDADGELIKETALEVATPTGVNGGIGAAQLADGTILVTGTAQFSGFVQRFDADGTPDGVADFVLTRAPDDQPLVRYELLRVIDLADGGYALGWVEAVFESQRTVFQTFDADGTPRIEPVVANTFQIGTRNVFEFAGSPQPIAELADGTFVVIWGERPADIFAQRYQANGTPIGDIITVNQTPGAQLRQQVYQVEALKDGGFAVVWSQFFDSFAIELRDLFVRTFNSDGTPRSDELLLGTTDFGQQKSPTIIASDDGGFVVTWGSDIVNIGADRFESLASRGVGRKFDANGQPEGDEFFIPNTISAFSGFNSSDLRADGSLIFNYELAADGLDGIGQVIASDITEGGVCPSSDNLGQRRA